MQVKIGFGFLILVIIVLSFLLWRSNKKLKEAKKLAEVAMGPATAVAQTTT